MKSKLSKKSIAILKKAAEEISEIEGKPYRFAPILRRIKVITISSEIEILKSILSSYFNLPFDQIYKDRKNRENAMRRHIFAWICIIELKIPYRVSARHLQLDPTSVKYAIKKLQGFKDVNAEPHIFEHIENIKKLMQDI